MGDPAGIGPEILAAAAVDPVVQDSATLVGIGHEEVLRKAAAVMGLSPKINLTDQGLGNLKEKALNLIHLDNVPMERFAYGRVDGACGKASFDYIALASELAMQGKVDAIATAPINKESLKAAGVPHIGHTEILADLSRSNDPLTMFQVHDLRVFFLTRHLSLIDACKAIKKERVLDYIRRCTAALQRLGIDAPRMVVAGLNPHCGEHGLFGDEEDREILPGIQAARQEGFNVEGPKPADSVFHFALKGGWDAVLSLYHDQGHIATKMVDFERTISLTLGLPYLRTSVDHGTAYDIAGTGKVSPVSMVEAIRLAALYAPNFRRAM
jgi:4-hydroxythreonine-4-phosphate dehydrogenase